MAAADTKLKKYTPSRKNAAILPRVPLTSDQAIDFQSPIITLTVGETGDIIYVHKKVIAESSKFVKVALSNTWSGHLTGNIQLPDEGTDLVNIYVHYLYTGTVLSQREKDMTEAGEDLEWDRLLDLIFLADYLMDNRFHNSVVNAMIEKWHATRKWPIGYAYHIYEHTPTNACIRQLIVDMHVYLGMGKCTTEETEAPKEFFLDVTQAFANAGYALYNKSTPEPWDKDICKYHIHEDEHDLAACSAGRK